MRCRVQVVWADGLKGSTGPGLESIKSISWVGDRCCEAYNGSRLHMPYLTCCSRQQARQSYLSPPVTDLDILAMPFIHSTRYIPQLQAQQAGLAAVDSNVATSTAASMCATTQPNNLWVNTTLFDPSPCCSSNRSC
jgi:hypothetical protein